MDKDAQVAHLMVLPLLFLGEQVAILLCIFSVPLVFFCWCWYSNMFLELSSIWKYQVEIYVWYSVQIENQYKLGGEEEEEGKNYSC